MRRSRVNMMRERLHGVTTRHLVFAGLFVCLSYWVHFWPTFHAANESIRLYFVQAVVDYGTASVDEPRARYGMSNVDKAHYRGRDYMDKAPGLSLLSIPVYWVATRLLGMSTEFPELPRLSYLLLLFGVVLPGVFGAYGVYHVIRARAGPDERAESMALIGALIVGLATPYGLYCTLFFGHGPAAAFGAMSLATIDRSRVIAGALAGMMVLIDTPTAILALALGIYVLVHTRSFRAMIEFGVGGLPPIAVQLLYNTWLFGHPFTFAYAHKASGDLATIHAQGLFGFSWPTWERLFGLSFGPERGLFFHAPVLLLAFFGGKRARPFLAISGVYFLWIAAFVDWQAGASYAPRHLTPIIPILTIPATLAWMENQRVRRIAPALAVYSGLMTFAMTATFPYAMIPFRFPVLEQALPMLATGSIAPNLFGLTGYSAAIPPLLIGGCMCIIFGDRSGTISGVAGLAAFLLLISAPVPAPSPMTVDSLSRATAFNGYPETAKNLCTHHQGYRWVERAWACIPQKTNRERPE